MAAYTQFGYSYPTASQLLVSSQPTAGNTGTGGGNCCENGRLLIADPVSGQSVCSCQYDTARLAALQSSYPRLAGSAVYSTTYPSSEQNPYPSIGMDTAAFYPTLGNHYSLKEGATPGDMSAWTGATLAQSGGYYPYDPTLAAYGYGAGYDLAARRKNATRESTATLKAWLNEHKKNPYPTKGEKIMLAIITKMTLTQVSTWFANARRRLKKENKMTWEPRNRVDDEDGLDDDDVETKDGKDEDLDKGDDISKIGRNDDHPRRESHEISGGRDSPHTSTNSPISVSRSSSPVPLNFVGPGSASSTHVEETGSHQKPRIWSIVDTATSGTPSLGASAFTAPGKLLPSLAGHHRVSPYTRPFPGEGPGVSVSSSETFLGAYAKTLQSFPGLGSIPPFSLTSSLLKPPPGLLNGFLAHAGPPSVSSSGNSANINPHLHSASGLPTKLPHSLSVTSK